MLDDPSTPVILSRSLTPTVTRRSPAPLLSYIGPTFPQRFYGEAPLHSSSRLATAEQKAAAGNCGGLEAGIGSYLEALKRERDRTAVQHKEIIRFSDTCSADE
ncbi:hypothetical protein GCM10010191_03810 [Actinomadura vinacea]|uniref:DUF5753 domain-containing protein n=1 Tax=Actinomadura vinacea TaxID=115336 RepID=A0ABP5VD19_9ACTN